MVPPSKQRGARRLAMTMALGALALPTAAFAQPAGPTLNPHLVETQIHDFVAEAARRFDIPVTWIWAVIRVESRGDPHAISPAGAMGLMQIMPATWASERARFGLGGDPFDRHDNILAGVAFLRDMRDRYGTDGMLAAYNAGPGRYEDYRFRGRLLPPETIAYVAQLAPAIGGDALGGQAAADPLAWTRASLFSAHASDTPVSPPTRTTDAAGAPPIDGQANGGARTPVADIEPPSTGLFISPSGQRTP